MIIRRGYRSWLAVTATIDAQLTRLASHARVVWNQAPALNRYPLDAGVPLLGHEDLASWLRFWKTTEARGFLAEAPAQLLEQRPALKQSGRDDTLRCSQDLTVRGHRVYLSQLGGVKFFQNRAIPKTLKNTTIARQRRRWFISFQTGQVVSDLVSQDLKECVGSDLGVGHFLALSDGAIDDAPRATYARLRPPIVRLQRQRARSVKVSKHGPKTKRWILAVYDTPGWSTAVGTLCRSLAPPCAHTRRR